MHFNIQGVQYQESRLSYEGIQDVRPTYMGLCYIIIMLYYYIIILYYYYIIIILLYYNILLYIILLCSYMGTICSSVWNPFLQKDLESVQRCFTRSLPSLKLYSYPDCLKILKIDSLELRPLKMDLSMYYKILNGLVDLDAEIFFKIDQNEHSTRTNGMKLHKSVSKSSLHSNTFSHRCINCWNALPPDIVLASSLSSFKHKLNEFDFSRFSTL